MYANYANSANSVISLSLPDADRLDAAGLWPLRSAGGHYSTPIARPLSGRTVIPSSYVDELIATDSHVVDHGRADWLRTHLPFGAGSPLRAAADAVSAYRVRTPYSGEDQIWMMDGGPGAEQVATLVRHGYAALIGDYYQLTLDGRAAMAGDTLTIDG